jgi:hypothetical protein
MAVFLESCPSSSAWFQLEKQNDLTHEFLVNELSKQLGIVPVQNFPCKFFNGHHEILLGSCNPWPKTDTFVRTSISLAGGKGGFGSMLRYVSFQIIFSAIFFNCFISSEPLEPRLKKLLIVKLAGI